MPPQRRRRLLLTSATDWEKNTELIGLTLELVPAANYYLNAQYRVGLHAWFLDRVRQIDPVLSQVLHDEQTEKAFTLSALEGELLSEGKSLKILAERPYRWTITALTAAVVQWLSSWVGQLPEVIELRSAPLPVAGCQVLLKPTTYRQLWDETATGGGSLKLSFLTPTSFRRQGHHFPLPVPTNIFHSYLRRWNDFSGMPFDQEAFLAWVERSVIIVRHAISSQKVQAGKRGSVTGFTGAVELNLARSAYQQPEFVQLFYALGQLAPYCGTGHKTPFGLGQTRLGWSVEEVQPTSSLGSLVAERIEELTELFLSQRKRQGGDRAWNMAQTLATILARREFGESLKDIAQDLEIPYETVKTYAKLARKMLKD